MHCYAFQILRETAKWALDRPPLERAVEALEIAGVFAGHDVTPPDPPADVMAAARQLRGRVRLDA